MLVFQDVFTRDEVMSECFKFELAYEDSVMKVKSAMKNKESVGNIDIGCGNAFGGSDEDGDSGSGDGTPSEKVLDVPYNFNLVQTSFSKSDFMTFIKNFVKNLKTYLEENGNTDRVATFQKGVSDFVKFLISKFDELEFYLGSSESLDGGIIIAFWEDETASGPVFYYFKDCLKEVKY
jgi:hypothetical protein